MTDPDRRQFLGLATAGTTLLAGCGQFSGDTERTPIEQTQSDETAQTDDSTRTVAVVVQPAPGALREAQLEVRRALENGELDQQEARTELARREQELLAEAIGAAKGRIEQAGATHLETVEREGTLLVEGQANQLLNLLAATSISAIRHERHFENAEIRAERRAEEDTESSDDTAS